MQQILMKLSLSKKASEFLQKQYKKLKETMIAMVKLLFIKLENFTVLISMEDLVKPNAVQLKINIMEELHTIGNLHTSRILKPVKMNLISLVQNLNQLTKLIKQDMIMLIIAVNTMSINTSITDIIVKTKNLMR